MEEIIGKKFLSFAEFKTYFEQIQIANKEVFYMRSNSLIPKETLEFMENKSLRYSRIIYHCKFDKGRATQATGNRKSS